MNLLGTSVHSQSGARALRDLRYPSGLDIKTIWFDEESSANDQIAEPWTEFLAKSPEASCYSSPPYISFAARQNGIACVVCAEKGGAPYFAIPVHPKPLQGWTTGYSGVLFPDADNERQLKKRLDAFQQFLSANPRISIEILQSAQIRGWRDQRRRNQIFSTMAGIKGIDTTSVFTRVIDFEETFIPEGDGLDLQQEPDWLTKFLQIIDPQLRNQIRRSSRDGVSVKSFNLSSTEEREEYLGHFIPLHEESWKRTGMTPHTSDYLHALSIAISSGGASDIGIIASRDGCTLAAVNVHVFGEQSLYWSGCSSTDGMKLNANPLALLAGIIEARRAGASSFELGRFNVRERSSKELAITKYKSQFGGTLYPIFVGKRLAPIHQVTNRTRAVLESFSSLGGQ